MRVGMGTVGGGGGVNEGGYGECEGEAMRVGLGNV